MIPVHFVILTKVFLPLHRKKYNYFKNAIDKSDIEMVRYKR